MTSLSKGEEITGLHKCVIRKDLEDELLIPVWHGKKLTKFINPTEPVEYRWIS